VKRARFGVAALLLLIATGVPAQPAGRRLTTVDAVRQYPGYFHLQPVLVRGELSDAGERVMLRSDEHEMRVLLNATRRLSGAVEVRAQVIDVGRLERTDPRVANYHTDEDRWPRPGEELILNVTGLSAAQPSSAASVRALALEPWKFEGQTVTLVGQFRGRNLFGDVPDAPGRSRYDFVLKAADAAVWVTGLRPRGKDFELNVDRRADTGRWLEISGVVSYQRGLVSIEAKKLVAANAPALNAEPEEPVVPAVPPEPVDVIFSTPTEGETDVSPETTVRVQFSRSIDPASLKGRIRLGYLTAESGAPGQAPPPSIEVQTTYDPAARALHLKFSRPLERYRTLRLELLDGVKAFDGAPVRPWRLTFSVGG
jgi:hypothetical protein